MNWNKKCKICAQCDEYGEKNFSAVKFFIHHLCGEKNSALPGCVGKKNSALPGCVGKKIQRYQDAVKKISTLKVQFIERFNTKFNAYLKFTGIIIDVSDRWRSGKRRR